MMKFKDKSLNITFIKNPKKSCKNNTILIAVITGPSQFLKRKWLRETWFKDKLSNHELLIFSAQSTDSVINGQIRTEAAIYDDIVILDFMDAYHNISIKMFSILAWKEKYCKNAPYVLRVNDDVVANLTNLQVFAEFDLKVNHETTKRIYGSILTYRPVVRAKDYKWYVSEQEYPEYYFPFYCDGGACLYTKDAVTGILSQTPKTTYVWVDDVLYSGILAEKANVSRIDRCDLFRHFSTPEYEKYLNRTYEPLNFIAVHVDDLTAILQTKYRFDNKW